MYLYILPMFYLMMLSCSNLQLVKTMKLYQFLHLLQKHSFFMPNLHACICTHTAEYFILKCVLMQGKAGKFWTVKYGC